MRRDGRKNALLGSGKRDCKEEEKGRKRVRRDLLLSAADDARKHAQSCAYASEDAHEDGDREKGGKEGKERARDTKSCKTMTRYLERRRLVGDRCA